MTKSNDCHTKQFIQLKALHLSKAKLGTITEVTTLLAGFAVVATVELQINKDENAYLLTAFGVTTALLVSSSLFSLMISTCVLPYLVTEIKVGGEPKDSPHKELAWFVDIAWVLSNCVSIFLFVVDLVLLGWIKFTYFSVSASLSITLILIPVLICILAFGVAFYRDLISHHHSILKIKMSSSLTHTPNYLSWRKLHLAKSKLRGVAEMSSFMSGFAVVATVELQINEEDSNPALLTAFVLCTSFLVATSMMAISISTCLLPHIQAVAKMGLISEVDQSPHQKMTHLVSLSWVLANTGSLFFFTLDVILLCWIKFTLFSRTASICATVILLPILLIILLFGVAFYRKITKHHYVISTMKCEELEKMKEDLEIAIASHSSSATLRSGGELSRTESLRSRSSISSTNSFQRGIFIV